MRAQRLRERSQPLSVVRYPRRVPQRPLIGKVVCYVTRGGDLLVFLHRSHNAGVQVPAGTIDLSGPPL